MGVIDGATHMNFAGSGLGANRVEALVIQTIRAFLLTPPLTSVPSCPPRKD